MVCSNRETVQRVRFFGVSGGVVIATYIPDICWLITNREATYYASAEGTILVFSSKELACAWVEKTNLKGFVLESYSWSSFLAKFIQGGRTDKMFIDFGQDNSCLVSFT